MLVVPSTLENAKLLDATRNEEPAAAFNISPRKRVKRIGQYLQLKDHIIVCCANFEVWTLLCTVRASFISAASIKPVVLMCTHAPTEDEWRGLSVFPQFYYIQGSALKRNDMLKAGLRAASAVVMMKLPSVKSVTTMDERFVDNAAIMAAHQIDFMAKDKYVITELLTRNNIKFMRVKYEMLDSLPKFTTQLPTDIQPMDITHTMKRFTYRRTVPSGALAAESANANDNASTHMPHRVDDSEEGRASNAEYMLSTEDPGYYAHSAIFASGRVLPGDMFDGLVFEAFRTTGIVEIVKLLCGRRYQRWEEVNDYLGIGSSVLSSMQMPQEFIGRPFATLYKHLALKHGCTVMGIYRRKTRYDVERQLKRMNEFD